MNSGDFVILVDTLYIPFEDDWDGLTRERAAWMVVVDDLTGTFEPDVSSALRAKHACVLPSGDPEILGSKPSYPDERQDL